MSRTKGALHYTKNNLRGVLRHLVRTFLHMNDSGGRGRGVEGGGGTNKMQWRSLEGGSNSFGALAVPTESASNENASSVS